MAYFQQTGPATYLPTEHVGGAWDPDEQHIAPALGLLAHVVEQDRDLRRDDRLLPARLSYDIWGTVPMEEVETSVRVLRPGRTIELVEATLSHGRRTIVTLRAWLMSTTDTSQIAGTHVPAAGQPTDVEKWDPTTVWPGGFIAAAHVRRSEIEPGRATFWVRTDETLVEGQQASSLARAAGLLDISNGMTVRVDPRTVAFPNLDLTAHLMREPVGDWLGFDTSVSFGAQGVGVTSTVLHDETGLLGTMSQILTIRPG
ncbi:thioesterase family protein [Nocardioides seonyuensis]|uniref:Thioesterase family protein n=1 Tax=Nocardioides seonyuensis TaxID=2518371 RepID=A0A4P7IDA6_9ACTN|nr:thioesterase family protein [Nocardioides seonyuensis]QBX55134.1 thioesterase family protein [Nocardioides seonyuensis]